MADPTKTVTNPRIAKLIQYEDKLDTADRQELETYRELGQAPKKASTSLTESQGKATGFYGRALEANNNFNATLSSVQPRGYTAQKVVDAAPDYTNTITDDDRQLSEQAKRNFILASLRYESGASINADEFAKQERAFFPRPGDGAKVIAQKAHDRQVVIQGLQEGSGPGADGVGKASDSPDYSKELSGTFEPYQAQLYSNFRQANPKATPGQLKDFAAAIGATVAAPGATPPAPGAPPPAEKQGAVVNTPILEAGSGNVLGPSTGPVPTIDIHDETAAQTPEFRAGLAKLLADPTVGADQIRAYWSANAKGAPAPNTPAEAEKIAPLAVERGKNGITDRVDAAIRGAADTASLGFADEISAGARTLFGDKTMRENLAEERGVDAYDQENHGVSRFLGQLGGGAVLPFGDMENAANVAKTSALYGGAYGFGSGNGGLGQRFLSAGVGAAVGGATGYGIGKLSELYHANGGPPPPPTDAQNTFAAAQRQDIPILPQDVGGAGIGRATQGAAQTPFGAGTVSRAANKLYDRFMGRVGELAGNAPTRDEAGNIIGAHAQAAADQSATAAERTSGAVEGALGAPVDTTGAGQLVQRGVSRWMDETGQRATGLYNDIPIAADREAVVSNTRAALADMTQGMSSNPQLSAMFKNGRLEGYMDALTPKAEVADGAVLPGGGRAQPQIQMTGGKLNWEDLSAFRTRVGDMLDDPRLTDDIATRQLRKLYGALSEDIKATAQAEGPEAFTKWKRANDYYDGRMKRINDTLSMVVGDKKDATPNEAMSALQSMIKEGRSGNAAAFSRVMRSIPAEDRDVVRASIVNDARGGRKFDPAAFAKAWGSMSERGKSALLPQDGMRALMDDAAMRASASDKNPFAGKSGEQIFETFDKMATNKGDRARFKATMDSLSPDEASHVRSTYIDIMGRPPKDAREAGEADFSITRWVNRYNDMPATSKAAMFGTGDLRSALEDLATVAGKVKASERLAGHSNTGAINSLNATTGGLGAAAAALISGHPVIAMGLASPAAYQAISARVLTSPTLVRWLAGATRTSLSPQAYIERLGRIAVRSPSIAQDALGLQKMMMHAVNDNAPTVARAAASDAKGPDQQQQK